MQLKSIMVLFMLLIIVSGCSFDSSNQKYEIIYQNDRLQPKEGERSAIEKEYTIAVIPKVSGIPYFNAVEEGVLEAGKDLNVHVLYAGPLIADWQQQEQLVKEYIEKEVDAIAISANDPEKLGPILMEAKQKGIVVMTWDSDTNEKFREYFVSSVDPETLGRHVMDTLSLNMKEKGAYAIITGSDNAATLKEWTEWMVIQQEENYPKMKLLEVEESNDNPQRAYMIAKELLVKYPDLKGIIGSSSVGPPAAAQAVMDANKVGEIAVVGLSSPNLVRSYLKNEAIQISTLWSPKKLGYLTVSVAKEILLGNEVTDNKSFENVGIIRVKDDTIIMGQPIDFTKENIDQYDF
ncbi:autoinducer 2 ABC transporter substrate-binding protein [Niallia circulans]|uniref:Autoinducer 2 ABC transporter substrate-binding protein n=1 Tax=Niallia circulans TaxID=1397 RepID=A0A941GKF3_NIACI|nr:autoinducer 2 ABC transporter substrate-binding protein [Niallia circulans]MCB5239229.1 autoinducer 2 ABC transporter substrate-binding protein [Niallia circulans]